MMNIPQHLLNQVEIIDPQNVLVRCGCGNSKVINKRSLIRKWSSKPEYLCKSCSVKTYANNPEKIAKCKRSYAKSDNADRHKKCSESAKMAWATAEQRAAHSVRLSEFHKSNDKMIAARERASKTFQMQPGFIQHLHMIRRSAHIALRQRLIDDPQLTDIFLNNFKLHNPETKEKHRISTSRATKKRWDDYEYRLKMLGIFNSPEYVKLFSENSIKLWTDPEYRIKMLELYGSPEYKQRQSEISKEVSSRPEVKEKLAIARAAQGQRTSSIQIKLYEYLDQLNVKYYPEGPETRRGYYVFDCYVPKQGNMQSELLIECQGDYWHSLPDATRNDKSKFTYIDRYFPECEIMYVWEHEFYTKDRVLDRIQKKLGINIETVDFQLSDIQLRTPEPKDVKTFLDAYHYIGKGRGGTTIGAYLNDIMIGCVIYSPPLRQNMQTQFNKLSICELSRLCIHPSYHKHNFASWLISRSLKLTTTDLIVAYADTTVGHTGIVYKASNFLFHHMVPADYWYVDNDGYVMHKRTLYGQATRLKMSESEFAAIKGYHKKYGGEKICYITSKNKLLLSRLTDAQHQLRSNTK